MQLKGPSTANLKQQIVHIFVHGIVREVSIYESLKETILIDTLLLTLVANYFQYKVSAEKLRCNARGFLA
jgi:hypothetical protein